MKGAWFSVICEVNNGMITNKISRVVYALTASSAKRQAKEEFAGSDDVKILDAYPIRNVETFTGRKAKYNANHQ
jgi:hypothetical protein